MIRRKSSVRLKIKRARRQGYVSYSFRDATKRFIDWISYPTGAYQTYDESVDDKNPYANLVSHHRWMLHSSALTCLNGRMTSHHWRKCR